MLGINDQKTEGVLTSGPVFDLYNKIVYKNNSNLNQFTFFDKTIKASLHSITPATPADQFIITNYVHDATTGILTFDYKLTISKYRAKNGGNYGKNSTGNDLAITGSYNSGGKVYKNKVNRIGS